MESEREVQRERGQKRERSIKYEKWMRLKESGRKDRQAEREEMKREWSRAWVPRGPLAFPFPLVTWSTSHAVQFKPLPTPFHPTPRAQHSSAIRGTEEKTGKKREEKLSRSAEGSKGGRWKENRKEMEKERQEVYQQGMG